MNCLWTIRVRPGRNISFTFDGQFEISNTTAGCDGDYLKVKLQLKLRSHT